MEKMSSDWYRKIWSLDIQDQSWVEDTKRQVSFLVWALGLTGAAESFIKKKGSSRWELPKFLQQVNYFTMFMVT